MSLESDLTGRSGGMCELCGMQNARTACDVPPGADGTADTAVLVCRTCLKGITGELEDNPHWRCLTEAVWSPHAPVQVTSYRLLQRLAAEPWARDTLEIVYLDPDVLAWAERSSESGDLPETIHRDAHGAVLAAGDTVTLIKDLVVKGGGFTAKRGTAVRGISLVADNETQIEGRVNGQRIVILTEFTKKSA